jgi:hypothetical protein
MRRETVEHHNTITKGTFVMQGPRAAVTARQPRHGYWEV